MIWYRTLFVLSGAQFALAAASLGAPATDAPLDAVLARLDQASATFKSLTADIRKVSHTEVVNVDDVDSGTIKVKRQKPKELLVRMDIQGTNPKGTDTTNGYIYQSNIGGLQPKGSTAAATCANATWLAS